MDDKEEIIKLRMETERLKQQITRLTADAESEKETRKRRNIDIDNRLKPIEDWKNNLQGRMVVIVIVGIGIWGLILSYIAWKLNKI